MNMSPETPSTSTERGNDMGWFIGDVTGHEGYIVGVVEEHGRWRELMLGDGDQPVRTMQVGCDCGWRSPRMMAPPRAEYWPSVVHLRDDRVEDVCRELWREHVRAACSDRWRSLARRCAGALSGVLIACVLLGPAACTRPPDAVGTLTCFREPTPDDVSVMHVELHGEYDAILDLQTAVWRGGDHRVCVFDIEAAIVPEDGGDR